MGDDRIDLASTVAALGQTQLPETGGTASSAAPVGLTPTRFVQMARLGAGGMGIVEAIWDGDLMRELAIKRIRPELHDDARVVAMFLWEARVTAYLDHPSIVPVHDLGLTADGRPYYAMKRVRGASLAEVLERLRARDASALEQWSIARRLRVFHQVCAAVAFAHRRGVLHRDLKPANIMVGTSGEVMVMDWGLALPLASEAGARLSAVVPSGLEAVSAGTPAYMSPEQAAGERIDERSDVYTLGVILYELMSLAPPSSGELRPLREVWRQAPRPIAAVIDRAIQQRAPDRYANVGALADDLERLIDGRATTAEHASAPTQFGRWYMSRDPRVAKLHVVDIDLIAAFGMAVGVACGAAFSGYIGHWWWIALVAGALAAIRPIVQWVKRDRDA